MTYLAGAILALAVGPAVVALAGRRRTVIPFLDGFVVTAVSGLVFLHFVPAAVEEGDFLLLGALIAGVVAPVLVERTVHDRKGRTDRWALVLGLSGLGIHTVFDGAALPGLQGGGDLPLGLAISLHRLPVGLVVWWLVRPHFGRVWGTAVLAGLMAATAVGYLGGEAVAHGVDATFLGLYQAAVGGSLVHVVFHGRPSGREPTGPGDRRWEGAGAIGALSILVGIVFTGPAVPDALGHDALGGFARRLFVLTAESAPALLLAYLFAGLLNAFLPGTSIRWMSRGGSLSSATRGMAIGLPFPVCSCGVVPLYRTLVDRGAPPAAAMAFLVATPELGLDALLLSIPMLGPEMTVLRLVTAAMAALLTGWWVGGKLKARPPSDHALGEEQVRGATGARLRRALRTGLGTVVDHTAPWIVLGLGVAALAAPLLEGGWLGSLSPTGSVFLFALLGFPTYVCASSATPLVGTLLATGLSPGAAIAFLITGPATNLSTLGVVTGAHGRRAAATFAATLVSLAVSSGLAINGLVGTIAVPTLARLTEEPPGRLQGVALVLLILLFLASLLRRGVRGFLGEVRAGLGEGDSRPSSHPLAEEAEPEGRSAS